MDQRTAMQWVIRVDGSNVAIVDPGETVEIGRKPIRPLPQGSYRRVEIVDDTRSMSKRHAEFSVKLDGTAFIRDLQSTNGTYSVRSGNQLTSLPAGRDYQLQTTAARLLFGDVVVEFIAERMPAKSQEFRVPNLFDYATDDSRADDADANMSVDDILNLRAGEPTDLFNADSVKTRARQLKNAEQRSYSPFVDPLAAPLTSDSWSTQDEDQDPEAHPRDLFADAQDIAAGRMEEPAPKVEEFGPRVQSGPRHKSDDAPAEQPEHMASIPSARAMPDPVQAAAQSMRFQPTRSLAEPEPRHAAIEEDEHMDMEAPAVIQEAVVESIAQPTAQQENVQVADPVTENAFEGVGEPGAVVDDLVIVDEESVAQPQDQADTADHDEQTAEPADEASDEQADSQADNQPDVFTEAPTDESADADGQGDVPEGEAAAQEDEPTHDAGATVAVEQNVDVVETVGEPSELETTQAFDPLAMDDEPQDHLRFQRPADEPQEVEQPQYQPAFEPGSVFERVSKGEYDHPQELVEAGGYTSTDARRSDDFAEQFEMARHAELLPFLAMNPSLYDDLYAWLAAQGDSDIDEALNGNPGYEDYKKAVGK